MKMVRRFVITMLVLALCLAIAVPVFAAVNSGFGISPAGSYQKIRGSYSVDQTLNALDTNTSITTNPDNANLVVKIEFSYGGYLSGPIVKESARSALSLNYKPSIPYMGTTPNYVYTCHEVRNGTNDKAYFTSCEGDLSLN